MGKEAQAILREAIEKTNNDAIIFFIVMVVMFVIFLLPVYMMMLKERRERREARQERERNIIQVVTANSEAMTRNTEVMTSLKDALEIDGKVRQATLDRIHTRIDNLGNGSSGLASAITKVQASLDNVLQNQELTQQDVRQVLLNMDKEKQEEK